MTIDPDFPSAKIIAHSKAPNGEELITFEVELHRFILPEVNTHKALSRGYQSSRAIPILRQLEQIANDPAMPVYYGKDQAGMIAGDELDGRDLELAKMIILGMRDACLNGVKQLQKLGLHKQVSNRYVEPWMKTKGLVTATKEGIEAMFKLRIHFAAQPEYKLLAERMKQALDNSEPDLLQYGDYHLPYVNWWVKEANHVEVREQLFTNNGNLDLLTTDEAVKISCSCNAQVSYRRLDDSLAKALKVYDMLNLPVDGVYPEDPPHFSPTEHIVKVMEDFKHESYMCGNFHSGTFWQYRKALEMGMEQEFLNGNH